jgi:hypothetical protein
MFVRWKRRERTRRHQPTGEWVRRAVLVRSVRTAAGPRHRHVCYLGSIREGQELDHWHRVDFWASVVRNLSRAGIAKADRGRIVGALQSVVPKPDKASRAAAERELRKHEDRRTRGL